jgi:hypothetical protein
MSTQQTIPASAGLEPEKVDRIRAELEQILSSGAFQRSERHSRFLRFVCESTLNGSSSQLNEYLIAHSVFDRGADYSPGEDSVVRRQAYSLRQKLQEFYASEGKNDLVRIELPVGRYVPNFKFLDSTTVSSPAAVMVLGDEPHARQTVEYAQPATSRWKWLAAQAAIAFCCVIAGWAIGGMAHPAVAPDPVFARIWGPILTNADGSVICFSNALTAGIRQTQEPFPTDTLTRGIGLANGEADAIRKQFHLPAGGFFYINPSLAHAKMGEALGSVALSVLLTRAKVPVRAMQSRYLNWQDFRHQNLILLGHDEANQWLDPILSKLPIRQGRTTSDKPRRIVIAQPEKGERGEYYPDYRKGQNPPAEDYALITFVNSLDERHGLALINGVNTEGTLMALDYLTEASNLHELEGRLRKENPQHKGPWHFQAILHSELRDGVPSGIELIALRSLP